MLVVDAANVVGSRPNGWWRDRGAAAATLCRQLTEAIEAGRLDAPVVVVLEGAARRGLGEHEQGGLRVVHAAGSGDDRIAELVAQAAGDGHHVTVVTADRELRNRVQQVGADVVGPRWLLERGLPAIR
jgi:predicted RNA-binding protein with PIN domain